MQSKTSFFNWTHFRKTVCRFWPIWTAYFVIWAFCQPVMIVAERYYLNALRANSHVLNLAVGFGPVSAFFVSILSVMAVWSFLYSSRSCHGTACLPLRRENLFFSTAAAGIVPLLVANVLIALLTALAELACGFLNFGILAQSFAIMTLQLLLFIAAAFVPLPGAAGAQESGFCVFFHGIFQEESLMAAMVCWRFFSYYLLLVVGLIMMAVAGFRRRGCSEAQKDKNIS